jgi:glycosyltransferase involved in cell wall biosynthesis
LLINQWSLSYAQQQEWLMAGAHSQTFYEALSQKAGIYDALLILPYQTVLAQAAAWLAPERTILIPCLHNEPYAYLESARLLLEEVSGVLFLTPEEQTLAVNQLKVRLKQQDILGAAVSDLPNPPLKKHPSASPYLLAMGRLEAGKNLALLYDYMQRLADDGSNLRLMMVGDGPYRPPAQPPFELRGFVSEDEKLNLLAGAEALIHPSLNESFSLVLLEAWLAKCPVLVHRECPVTFGHVQRSQGGLAFTTYGEFSSAVHQLTSQAKWAEQMGENGRSYVLQNYTWPVIIDRLENILESWISQ